MFEDLQRAALGRTPVPRLNWHEVYGPACSLFPLLAWRLGSEAPARLHGVLRHVWARNQWLLEQARQISALAPERCLLLDGLALAARDYPALNTRPVEHIHLLTSPDAAVALQGSLQERGWKLLSLQSRGVELRSPEGIPLRLDHTWLPGVCWDSVCARSVLHSGCWLPDPVDLFWGHGALSYSPLWLVDLWMLRERHPEAEWERPGPSHPLLWRWNQLSCSQLGQPLLSLPQHTRWSLSDWLLALTHRRSRSWARLLHHFAVRLRHDGLWKRHGAWHLGFARRRAL